MTPIAPRPADAGTTTPITTPDASAETDASVPPTAPAATETPSQSTAGASAPLRLRLAVEGGLAWMDLSNSQAMDHFGGYGRAEAGMEYRFDDTFFAQAGVAGSFGALSRDLGAGVGSGLNYQSLLAHGRLGASFFGGNLRLTGGIELGATHVGASECEDGMSCGALFTNNAQLLPVDTWTFGFGADIGISTLQGALGIYLRYNHIPGVNPAYDVVDGDPLRFGLNISSVQVGIGVDLVSLYNLVTGNGGSGTSRVAESPESAPRVEEPEEVPAPPSTGPAEESEPQGLALVQRRHTELSEVRGRVTSTAAQVTSARGLYQSISGNSEAEMRNRRLYAAEAANQAQGAVEYYQELSRLLAEAHGAVTSLSGSDRNTAAGLIREMSAWQATARREASQAVREARQIAADFNRRPGHGDDLVVRAEDPVPEASPRRRTRPARATPRPDGSPPSPPRQPPESPPPSQPRPEPRPSAPTTPRTPPDGDPGFVFDPSQIETSPPPPRRRGEGGSTPPTRSGGGDIDENG